LLLRKETDPKDSVLEGENMYIEKVLTCKGLAGYFNKDLAAIKAGATPDGFTFRDRPLTPGFQAITQPGEALSVMFLLTDHQVAYGDCLDVIFAGAAGRDRIFKAAEHQGWVEGEVAAFLRGKPIGRFKDLAETLDSLEISGQKLHTAVRYGISQALLDATAKARHVTMAEVIASEYGCRMASEPIPLLALTTNEQRINIDKMILKKVPYLPHGSTSSLQRDMGTRGQILIDYARWLVQRINSLRDADYHPTIHLDVYGTIGEAFGMNMAEMADYIERLQKVCLPYPLMLETPVIADSRERQIQVYGELLGFLKNRGIPVKIIADEWCNTLEDIRAFVQARAADIVQIKTPDLGGIHNSIEAVLFCKGKGVGAYVGGTVNGTDQSAKVSAHIALASQADFLMAKPGQGVDEGLMIQYNEMQRALTLIKNRK
jgi:methylaspartate ammonia-lyase